MRKWMISYVCSLLLITFVTGCSLGDESNPDAQQSKKQEKLAPPDEQAHIVGQVINQDGEKITVVEDPKEPEVTLKAEVNLKESTRFLIRDGENKYRKGKKEDLKEGMNVEVWYDGIVVDAYPVQADGECIVYEKK